MNISVLFLATVWAFMYNSHFGWNWSSKSNEEIICDGIFSILIAISISKG